ncbi:MAG TPA: DUF6077 domain-containing protein [Nocardioides sp.]|uniref:DUF6077 domain-containing protein n=1 Tax=Nocardioides sp. TaxID=35761 RepID=UPI002F3F7F08
MVRRRGGSTAAWCDRLLDGVVVLLATWTLVYHVCLVTRLGTTPAIALELLALACAAGIAARRPWVPPPVTHGELGPARWVASGARPLRATTVVAACVAAVGTALSAPWVLVWVPWLIAAVAGIGWACAGLGRCDEHARPRPSRDDRADGEQGEGRWTVGVVLVWAVGLGIFSLWPLRSNPDDLFYLNVSQWVATHGEFPVRDTLFADLVYPMSNWPPVASYDGLVGVVARILGAHAASVEYMSVPPIATALSVLALWRLLRTWRVRHVAWVLSVALAFLLVDGTSSYGTPGNLFLTRLWQGKVILLCLVVPLLLVHALRYVERPTRSRLPALALTGVASVGLSTTAMFLTPLIALAAMAPLLPRARGRALAGFAAMAGYPLGAVVVTLVLGGRSADDFGDRRLYRFDASWIGHLIFLTGFLALAAVLAVLLGSLLVPHPAARVTTGVLVLCTGIVLVPGITRAMYDVTGVGPTLWRVSWGATIAPLVGVAAVRAASWLHTLSARWRFGRGATPVAALAALALLVGFGHPIWSHDTNAYFREPVHWQRSYASRSVVAEILRDTRPGDVVLAPDSISVTLAVTTTSVKTVAPREYYLHYLEHDPAFHYADRRDLWQYVNDAVPTPPFDLRTALRRVGVDVACTAIADQRRYDAIRNAGYRPLLATDYYRCLSHA